MPSTAAYAMNGQPVSSAVFYAAACNPLQSACVEACAGAGKTWMLIERIVQALKAGAAPEQILAITFTRKAAAEMRERFQHKLQEPEHHTLRDQVLASGQSVQISTFHAWFAQLLKAAPLATLQALGLPLQYELLESEHALIPELEQALYAKVLMDRGLQADLQALILAHGRHNTMLALLHIVDKRAEFELADSRGLLEDSVQAAADIYPAFSEALDAATDAAWLLAKPAEHAQLGLLARVLGQHHTATIQGWASNLELGLTKGDFGLACTALLTQKMEARKLGKMKLGVVNLGSESMDGEALFARGQAYVLEILAVQHQHACWLYQQRMSRLGRVLLAEFAALKRSRGLVDMPDLERAATTLLSDEALSGAIQERLDQKLRHVMIDEFQDTNPLQWQAMHAWLSSYAGSGGGQMRPSLFIVGDPKQSIYRFRRAEPRVFAAAQAFMQTSFEANLLSCDHTRRNSTAVLDVVNSVMLYAQEAGEYAGFRAHTTELAGDIEEGTAVALPLIVRPDKSKQDSDFEGEWRNSLTTPREDAEESLKEKEADQAARYLAQIWHSTEGTTHRSASPSMMVLSRTHAPLGLIQQALQRYGVPTDKQERHFLADSPAVQDVAALLNVLVSPHNNLDLAIALKSPIFGWSDAQLMALRTMQLASVDQSINWFDLLDGDVKVQLLRWQQLLYLLPPHDALQAIYDESDLLNRYAAALPYAVAEASQSALKALLWAALQQDGGRYLSAYAFVRALRAQTQTIKAPSGESSGEVEGAADQTSSSGAARKPVQLLTIHGAKGLEADVVLLLDSDAQAKASQSMTSVVDWPPEQAAPRKFVFLQTESRPPLCAQDLMQSEQKARDVETLNALYVAMTRARKTLVLSASAGRSENLQSVWNRLQMHCELMPEPAAAPAIPHTNSVIPAQAGIQTAALLSHSNSVIPLNRFDSRLRGNDGSAPSESAQIGQAMHRLLQWQAWGDAELAAVSQAFSLSEEGAQQAKTLASTIAQGEAAWVWNEMQIDWQANEYELPDPVHAGGWLRIDRLVRHTATQVWWIVDFKSSLAPEQSRMLCDQLALYRQAVMQALNAHNSQVKSAFVNGVGQWVESI